jgi:5,10-methylene-tetrahydrofolate dehydrogenase/methenyl tetrahydrofolate cyclohydrolase
MLLIPLPISTFLQERDATVIMAHSRTKNPEALVKQADIVVAACGRAEMVRGDWIKEGAVVIDVGINAVDVSANAFCPWIFSAPVFCPSCSR